MDIVPSKQGGITHMSNNNHSGVHSTGNILLHVVIYKGTTDGPFMVLNTQMVLSLV